MVRRGRRTSYDCLFWQVWVTVGGTAPSPYQSKVTAPSLHQVIFFVTIFGKLYPIGIQTFSRIREEDLFYIDKTAYVYHMTHTNGVYFFLSRPRRFGKSLLVSTFHSYFEGRKDLFEGLAIERLEKEWTEYPVLQFSLAGGKHMEKEQLERYLLGVEDKGIK